VLVLGGALVSAPAEAREISRASSARLLITGLDLSWPTPGEEGPVALVLRGRATLFNDGQDRMEFRYTVADGRGYLPFLAACGAGNLTAHVDFGPEAELEDGEVQMSSGLRDLRCRQR